MGKRVLPASGAPASFRNAILACLRGAGWRPGRGPKGRARIAVARPGHDARRVIVKAYFTRLTASGASHAARHLRYIERDGVEKDGSRGVLYGADGPERAETFHQPRPGEKHQFRVIVSPDEGGELDLTAFVRTLMARVERDIGRRLDWAAVNHHNTEHPHAHLVIRGVDRQGHELRFDRNYISNGLRWRAQEIATRELGPRPEHDILRAYKKEITQERFTSLDRELERRAVDSRVQGRSPQARGPIDESVLIGRLKQLERMRLAARVAPNEWVLTPGWEKTLRDLSVRGDIIKQMHAALPGDPARYHVVRPGQALHPGTLDEGQLVTGRVASKGLADELKGTFYAVIETPTGRAYHVPLDVRSVDALRTDDLVSLATKPETPVRPVDRHIAELSSRDHGVYALQGDRPDAERVARRLRDLERAGLVRPADSNRWTVAPDLLAQLEERHRRAPERHRLLIHKQPLSLEAQVRHPGPVWLDRVDTASLAPAGLGADVLRAIKRRADALRHVGIADDDPNKFAKLRELERRSLAKQVAKSTVQIFLQSTPDAFRGRVLEAHTSPTGTSYTAVSDGQRFVLMKTSASLRAMTGKSVDLSRDARGRVVVRESPDRGLER